MKDVARVAGVSQPAVSYAYNRPDQVSVELRRRVLETADALGYPGPNPIGRGLRRGDLGSLGLMITDSLPYAFSDPATVELLRGIAMVGEVSEVTLTLLPLRSAAEAEDVGSVEHCQAAMTMNSLVDGFIVYSLPDGHRAVAAALSRRLPLVVVDAPRSSGIAYLGIRDRAAARRCAELLLALGHRRVGVLIDRLVPDGVAGPVDAKRRRAARDGVARERLRGYEQAFAAAGVEWQDVAIVEAGGFDNAATGIAVRRMLDEHPRITAVLASTDVLALETLRVCEERGIAVPSGLSVVGFDDVPAATAAGLTTMRQPLLDKGRRAVQLLLDEKHSPRARRIILPTSLVVRRSTGPAARRSGARSSGAAPRPTARH